MSSNEEVRELLKEGQSLFFPDTDPAFRKAFIQRWYSDIKRQFQRRVRAQQGTHDNQSGTFVWTEEIQ